MKPSVVTTHERELTAAVRALGVGELLPDTNTRSYAATLGAQWLEALDTQGPARALMHAASKSAVDAPQGWLHHEVWSVCSFLALAEQLSQRGRAPGQGELTLLAHELAARTRALCANEADMPPLHALDAVVTVTRKRVLTRRNALDDSETRAFEHLVYDQLSHALSRLFGHHTQVDAVVTECVRGADRQFKRVRHLPVEVRREAAQRALLAVCAELSWCCADALDVDFQRNRAALWLARTAAKLGAQVPHAERWIPDEVAAANDADAASEPATPSDTMSQPKPQLQSVRTQPQQQETSMKDSTNTLLKTLHTDATEAAWRTAGTQFVKLAREPLVGVLTRHLGPGDEALRARIAGFLETELGTAMLSALLSAALGALPLTAGEVPQRLSRELRVRAMADTGDVLADVLMGPLRQVVQLYLQDPTGAPLAPASAPAALPASQLHLGALGDVVSEREGAPIRS